MPNLAGKSYGFTALTPIRRRRTWGVRLAFLLIRLASPKLVQRLLHRVSLVQDQQRLIDLSFIHFARWVIVDRNRMPNLGHGQPAERMKYSYLLFCSNFDGEWEDYIDAFSSVIPGGMDLIWRWCAGYPRSRPITPFLRYIRHNQFETDYYYTAYPGATTTDIRGALALEAETRAFARHALHLPPEAFREAYDAFVSRMSRNLATTGPAPWATDPLEPAPPTLVRDHPAEREVTPPPAREAPDDPEHPPAGDRPRTVPRELPAPPAGARSTIAER